MKRVIAMGLVGMGSAGGVWAACNSPNNIRVTVDITAPVANQKLVMVGTGVDLKKEDDSAFTALKAKSSGDDNTKLKWTFTGFTFPAGNSGTSVAVKTPARWPTKNSFWGEKDVELKYDGGVESAMGDCKAKVGVKVFFNPVVKIGTIPAWCVYFKQKAVPHLTYFTPIAANDGAWSNVGMIAADTLGFYYVVQHAYNPVYRPSVESAKLYINMDHYTDVQEVAHIVAHEIGHMGLVQDVDKQYKLIIKKRLDGDITTEEYESLMLAVDSDDDLVVDSYDPDIGNDDQEDLAEEFADENEDDMLDKDEDWSEGGHNYGD